MQNHENLAHQESQAIAEQVKIEQPATKVKPQDNNKSAEIQNWVSRKWESVGPCGWGC